mmetsp:Transcript_12331/g.28196  ORF Transcript_12331/g.28196 Transcript_12331/m.28196 type:complete len:399 (-) Transcript_12331:11-1207(-)
MKRDVALLKAERKDREATLRDKEMEIGTHKVKVQTLKKFKHVLDYRLREVTESLKPKEDLIAQLHLQLSGLEEEFERQLEIQKQRESVLEAQTEKVTQLTSEAEKQKEILKQRERTIFRYSSDLQELAADLDTRNWHIGLKKIWREHVNPDIFKEVQKLPHGVVVEDLPIQELGRQIQVMERKASMLALRSKRGEATCKADTRSKTQENSLLIHELEELRIEKKSLQAQVQELQLQVRLAHHRDEQKALPSTHKSEADKAASHGTATEMVSQLSQAAQTLFTEAPEIRRAMPKGHAKKAAPERSVHHKSQEELRQAKLLRKQEEQKEQKKNTQRVRDELVPQELDSILKKRTNTVELHNNSVDSAHSSVSSGPPVGGAISVVRFSHQKGSPAGSVGSA